MPDTRFESDAGSAGAAGKEPQSGPAGAAGSGGAGDSPGQPEQAGAAGAAPGAGSAGASGASPDDGGGLAGDAMAGAAGAGGAAAEDGSAGASEADAGAAGVPDTPGPMPAKVLCDYLDEPVDLADEVTTAYEIELFYDCRVSGFYRRDEFAYEFRNQLIQFSYWLWGCPGGGRSGFWLVPEGESLTLADAAIVIDMYLEICRIALAPTEAQLLLLRDRLEELSRDRITEESDELSHSECDQTEAEGN